MFDIYGSKHRNCDGLNRRDFLRVGTLGALGGLALPDLLRAREAARAEGRPTRDASVVWLWLSGGPTHVETFDPKMSAPAEFRSTVGAVNSRITGVQLGGLLPRMANVADKMAFVRSFAHGSGSHGEGTYRVMTGYNGQRNSPTGQAHPFAGSILARHRGANHPRTGMPTYVSIGGIRNGGGPAWLGKAYEPFSSSGNARRNMEPRVDLERMGNRRSMSLAFDSVERDVDSTGMLDGIDQFHRQAFELIRGNARQAFDVSQESRQTREMYGGRGLGEQLLMARRLCEAGCGFVTLNYGGWDMHSNIERSLRRRITPLDQAVSAFVTDIHQRGLDRDILLVITGDFGRTPRINRRAGRDHWGNLCTLALAGGGLRMGQVVGESSSNVERPRTTTIRPIDLKATIFHALGMPLDLQFTSLTGRPMYMIEGGRPIQELV